MQPRVNSVTISTLTSPLPKSALPELRTSFQHPMVDLLPHRAAEPGTHNVELVRAPQTGRRGIAQTHFVIDALVDFPQYGIRLPRCPYSSLMRVLKKSTSIIRQAIGW